MQIKKQISELVHRALNEQTLFGQPAKKQASFNVPKGAKPGTPSFDIPAGAKAGTPDFGGNKLPTQKSQRQTGTGTSDAGWNEFDFPLKYGMKKDKNVYNIQVFLLPDQENYHTGNYLNHTKDAVAKFIQDHSQTPEIANYEPKDGSVVTEDLFDRMYAEARARYYGNQQQTQQTQQPAQTQTQQTPPPPPAQQVQQVQRTAPPFMFGDTTHPNLFGILQNKLRVPQTGVVDAATIQGIRDFLNNPKKMAFMKTPLAEADLNLINDKDKPGVTGRLYSGLIYALDLIGQFNMTADERTELRESRKRLARILKEELKKKPR